MAKLSYLTVLKKAFFIMSNRHRYAYFYGAKGQTLTKEVMDALWAAEPSYFKKYSAAEKEQIYRNSLGKIGLDCSGFVGSCVGYQSYSVAIKENSVANESIALGPEASILFTTNGSSVGRHIGLDIGKGYCMHFTGESTDAQVKAGHDSCWMCKISDIKWEYSGKVNTVDYTGSSNL